MLNKLQDVIKELPYLEELKPFIVNTGTSQTLEVNIYDNAATIRLIAYLPMRDYYVVNLEAIRALSNLKNLKYKLLASSFKSLTTIANKPVKQGYL